MKTVNGVNRMVPLSRTALKFFSRNDWSTRVFMVMSGNPLDLHFLMNFDEQDRQLRSLMARASSSCCGQAGSLSYHFLVGSRITDFVRQISSGMKTRPEGLAR